MIPLDGGRFCHVALIWFVRSSRRHASRAGDPHHRLRQEVRRAGGPGRQGRQLRLRLRRRRPPGAARRAARHQNQGERSELVLERVVQSPSKVQQTFRSSHPILRSKSAFSFSTNLQQILQSRVFSSKLRFNETDLFFSFFFLNYGRPVEANGRQDRRHVPQAAPRHEDVVVDDTDDQDASDHR